MAIHSEVQIPVFPAFSSQPEWRGLMHNTYFAPSTPGTAESEARGARYLAVLRFTNYVSDELSGDPFILLSEFCFSRTSAPRYGTLSRNVRGRKKGSGLICSSSQKSESDLTLPFFSASFQCQGYEPCHPGLYECYRPPSIMANFRVDSSLSIAVIKPPPPPSPSPPGYRRRRGERQDAWI